MKTLMRQIQTILGEDLICEVIYSLIESPAGEDGEERVYGFRLEEYWREEESGEKELVEMEEAEGVFSDVKEAARFFERLVREEVLPTTLIYHIDDWNCAFASAR